MAYTNPWVGYISRSYTQIKNDLLLRLQTRVPELTDLSESNILVIIVSMVAGVFEMINLYIDNMAQESFVQTARRLSSMYRLIKILDYRVKAANPATVDVTVIAINSGDNITPEAAASALTIPAFTIFSTTSGLSFMNKSAVTIGIGETGAIVPVSQISLQVNLPLGASDGITPFQKFALGYKYVFGTLNILIAGFPWTEVTSFGLALSTDKKFIVEVQEDGLAYVIFGDGITGAIPTAGQVIGSFQETEGTLGNVSRYAITTANPGIIITTTNPSNTRIYNEADAAGGLGYETLERIRVSAPLSIRTLDRAVTYQDYEDIARLCNGVGRAKVKFDCGKTVDIYIVPEGGGLANTALLATVKNWFEPRRMVTTIVNPLAAGETPIHLTMDVTAKFRADVVAAYSDIQNALLEFGSYPKQNINKPVKFSDIVAKVDNLPRVESLIITAMGTMPYARPNNHTVQLNWNRRTRVGSLYPAKWLLEYQTLPARIKIFKDSQYMGQVPLGTPWIDPQGVMQLTVFFGVYTNGMQWTFSTYPFKTDINLDDYTIPIIRVGDLNITMIEQFNPPII